MIDFLVILTVEQHYAAYASPVGVPALMKINQGEHRLAVILINAG